MQSFWNPLYSATPTYRERSKAAWQRTLGLIGCVLIIALGLYIGEGINPDDESLGLAGFLISIGGGAGAIAYFVSLTR